jgi:L-lactate permease
MVWLPSTRTNFAAAAAAAAVADEMVAVAEAAVAVAAEDFAGSDEGRRHSDAFEPRI